MHGRLLWPSSCSRPRPRRGSGAVPRDREIRKVEAITTSLVRVTLRAPLKGRLRVSFKRRDGVKGARAAPRSSTAASAPTSCSPAMPAAWRA